MPIDLVKHFVDDILLCSRDDRPFAMAVEYDKERKRRVHKEERQVERGKSQGRGENWEGRGRESRVKVEDLNGRWRGTALKTWRTTSAFGKMMDTLKLLLERTIGAKLRLQLKKC